MSQYPQQPTQFHNPFQQAMVLTQGNFPGHDYATTELPANNDHGSPETTKRPSFNLVIWQVLVQMEISSRAISQHRQVLVPRFGSSASNNNCCASPTPGEEAQISKSEVNMADIERRHQSILGHTTVKIYKKSEIRDPEPNTGYFTTLLPSCATVKTAQSAKSRSGKGWQHSLSIEGLILLIHTTLASSKAFLGHSRSLWQYHFFFLVGCIESEVIVATVLTSYLFLQYAAFRRRCFIRRYALLGVSL